MIFLHPHRPSSRCASWITMMGMILHDWDLPTTACCWKRLTRRCRFLTASTGGCGSTKKAATPRDAAHHNLEAYLDEYIVAAGIRDEAKGPSSAPRSAEPAC